MAQGSRRFIEALAVVLTIAVTGGSTVRADDPPISPPQEADVAVGTWGGPVGVKFGDGGVVDAFVLRVGRRGTGYDATSRADVTMPAGGDGGRQVVVMSEYAGEAKGDGIEFRSTERLRSADGGAPVSLGSATLVVTPKGDHVAVRVGSDAEGWTELKLVPWQDAAAAQAVRGEWGGEMPHAKLSENVILDELYVTVPAAAAFAADVRMECTVLKDGKKIPVTVLASYRDGRVRGDGVHFEIVPWHRTVPATGQKSELVGNPLLLRVTSEGKLAGTFEGDDGWPFTVIRRGAAAAPTPKPPSFDGLAGAWGGAFADARLNDDLKIREGLLDLSQVAGGSWKATLHMTFVVKSPTGDVLVKVDGDYPPGAVEGDALKFPATKLTRTIVSTGATNPIDGNLLEIRWEPDGRIETKFVGDGGFTLTMKRR